MDTSCTARPVNPNLVEELDMSKTITLTMDVVRVGAPEGCFMQWILGPNPRAHQGVYLQNTRIPANLKVGLHKFEQPLVPRPDGFSTHYISVSLHSECVVNVYLDLSIDGQTKRYFDATARHRDSWWKDWEIRYKSAEIWEDRSSGSLAWTVNP
jgi:hypothetical protein